MSLKNTLITDLQFVGRLSGLVRNFKHKKQYEWNFSCPVCGDSKTNPLKARFYILENNQSLSCYCHNCGYSSSFSYFLKLHFPSIYKDYVLEAFSKPKSIKVGQKGSTLPKRIFRHPKPLKTPSLDDIEFLNGVDENHPAIKYLMNRKIPEKYWKEFAYVKETCHLKNAFPQYKNIKKWMKEPRVLIPFYDETKKLFALQGRSLDKNTTLRYLTLRLKKELPLIYGMERVDKKRPIIVVEGPFDSLFLNNCVAVAGSDLKRTLKLYENCDLTFVFDNESRNEQINNNINQIIKMNKKIFIWPKKILEKDINDCILAGMPQTELETIIKDNSYTGLEAKLRMKT